jgi:hypothetical protein
MAAELKQSFVPASPGWFACQFIPGKHYSYFDETPVVAWDVQITQRTSDEVVWRGAFPIAPGVVTDDDGSNWCLKRPDGKYQAVNGDLYNESEMLEYFKQQESEAA